MSKPIVPGCRAVIINSQAGNDGKIVTVLDRYGPAGTGGIDMSRKFGDRWLIDTTIRTNHGNMINHMGEKQLQRIDDYDGDEVVTWDECIFKPKEKIKVSCY